MASNASKTSTPRKPAAHRTPARKPSAKTQASTRSSGNRALSTGAAVLAIGAGIAGFLARRQIAAWASPDAAAGRASSVAGDTAEHEAPDLALDKPHPSENDRAPVDFRPDMNAPMSEAEREALRPATGPAPSLVSEAGTMNSQTGASN